MPKIPENEINRLKTEVDLVQLVQSYNVKLSKNGRNLLGLCPMHNDTSPSLVVTPGKNLWVCKGACGKGGTTIDWIMGMERVDFHGAVEILQSLNGSMRPLPERKEMKKSSEIPEAEKQDILLRAINYYHESLKKSPEALKYLSDRGIGSKEALDQFMIGFCDKSLSSKLFPGRGKESQRYRKVLTEAGFLKQSGHEHFAGCIVFPIIDERGYVLEVYGRKISDTRQPQHLYLPGQHKGTWNPSAFISKEIILCESIIDALSFWVNGYPNVTASYGVEGFSEDHLNAVIQNKTEKIYIAYDPDEAGEMGAEKLSAKNEPLGIKCQRIQFPKDMDANDFCLTMKPVQQSLKVLLESSKPVGQQDTGSDPDDATSGQLKGESESPSLVASDPDNQADTLEITKHKNLNDFELTFGDRVYRIRGLSKNTSEEILKVNVKLNLITNTSKSYRHTFDLFHGKHLTEFVNASAKVFEVNSEIIRKDMEKLIDHAEKVQSTMIKDAMKPVEKGYKMTPPERDEAMALAKSNDILEQVLDGFEVCGLVGEKENALFGFLASISRMLPKPLHLIIQSSSSTGKSTLMDAILRFVPKEHKMKFTALTGQSLFYMQEDELQHKVIAISEDEGADRAGYALKILQSEGEISIGYAAKDPQTGDISMRERHIQGPCMSMKTTTRLSIDEEDQNRNAVLATDEDILQTQAIHFRQRLMDTLDGIFVEEKQKEITRKIQNLQRLLKPITVINPYAMELTFLHQLSRTRRDHMKYLTMIKAIALLHQYQRPVKYLERNGKVTPYIEVIPNDIRIANMLSHDIFGRSLDEMAPHTKTCLQKIYTYVKKQCEQRCIDQKDLRIKRKDLLKVTGLSMNRLSVHLKRLEDLEYIISHRGQRGLSYEYELLYTAEKDSGEPAFLGIIPDSKIDKWEKKLQKEGTFTYLNHRFTYLKAKFTAPLPSHYLPIHHPLPPVKNGLNPAKKADNQG